MHRLVNLSLHRSLYTQGAFSHEEGDNPTQLDEILAVLVLFGHGECRKFFPRVNYTTYRKRSVTPENGASP